MGKSFWGRLEAQKQRPAKKARKAKPRTGGEKREERLLRMLEQGTADDAIRQALRLVAEVRNGRG
jgi:hypothetical protein